MPNGEPLDLTALNDRELSVLSILVADAAEPGFDTADVVRTMMLVCEIIGLTPSVVEGEIARRQQESPMDASIGDVIRTIMDEIPPSPSWIVGNPEALFGEGDDEPIPFTVNPTPGQTETAAWLAEMAARRPESAGAHDEAPTNPEWTPWADLEGDGPPADALAPLTSWVSPDGSIEGYVDVVASPGDDIVKLDAWVNEALQRRFEDPRTRIHQRNPRQGYDDAAYKPLRYTFRLDSPLHDSLLKRGLAPEHGDAIIAGNAEPNGQLYDLPDTEINDDRKRLWANWTVAFDEGPEGFIERGT